MSSEEFHKAFATSQVIPVFYEKEEDKPTAPA
jgi:hypothetical protein